MSAATAATPAPTRGGSDGARNPVGRSTAAELLRLRKWPALWVVMSVWLIMNALFGYVFSYITYRSGGAAFASPGQTRAQLLVTLLPGDLAHQFPQGMPLFGGAIMMVLGAIIAGNGFGWGTWKTVFTQGPSRSSTYAGSVAAMTAFVTGLMVVTLILNTVMATVIALGESQTTTLPAAGAMVKSFLGALLVMETWALAGYLLGILARGPALSVSLGLVWTLVVENLLRGVGTSLSWVATFTHFLPGTAAGSLIGQMVGVVPGSEATTPGLLTTLSEGRALVTLLAYTIGLPVITWWLVRRRDVA